MRVGLAGSIVPILGGFLPLCPALAQHDTYLEEHRSPSLRLEPGR